MLKALFKLTVKDQLKLKGKQKLLPRGFLPSRYAASSRILVGRGGQTSHNMKLWGMCRRGRAQGHNPFLRKLKESPNTINFLCDTTAKKQFSYLNRELRAWQEMSHDAPLNNTIFFNPYAMLSNSDINCYFLSLYYHIMVNLFCDIPHDVIEDVEDY